MPRVYAKRRRSYKPLRKRTTTTYRGYGKYTKARPKTKTTRRNASRASRKTSRSTTGIGRALGSVIGSLMPISGGSAIGGGLGGAAESIIGNITGLGNYRVKRNSILEANSPPGVMNIHNGKGVVLRHREYLQDIITSSTPGAFNLQNFFVQPGLVGTFPWLAGIADQFQEYTMSGCLFEFKTMSADALNSTNTALGQVIMGTNYNAGAGNFASKAEMENAEFTTSCKPSCSMVHPIECDRSQSVSTTLYVRSGAVPAGQDQRLYDFGNFQIATNGFQAASVNIGELWVTYEFVFLKPRAFDQLGFDTNYMHASQGLTSYTNANPLGITGLLPIVQKSSTINATFSNTVITLDPTQWEVGNIMKLDIIWAGTGAVAAASPTFTVAGMASYNMFKGGAFPSNTAPQSGLTGTLTYEANNTFIVTSVNSPITITLGTGGTLPNGTTTLDVFIQQLPNQSA